MLLSCVQQPLAFVLLANDELRTFVICTAFPNLFVIPAQIWCITLHSRRKTDAFTGPCKENQATKHAALSHQRRFTRARAKACPKTSSHYHLHDHSCMINEFLRCNHAKTRACRCIVYSFSHAIACALPSQSSTFRGSLKLEALT
eukprot:172130-Pleurochrysis_carterae.AAC.4